MLKMQHKARHLLLSPRCNIVYTAMRGQLGDTLIIPLQSLSVFVLGPLQGNQVVQLQNFSPPSRDGGG